jgi:hypothetical protein
MLANVRDIGSVGVVSDVAAWDLPPNALTDGRNFRVVAGKVAASGGSKLLSTDGSAAGEIGHIEQSTDFEGTSAWLVCHDSGIDSYEDNAFTNLYDSGSVAPSGWTSCQIGQVTFFNNPAIGPIYFTDWAGTDPVTELNWSPAETWSEAGMSCRILQSHKNFLFAMGCTEPDPDTGVLTYYEDRVRWSHPCEPNGIPYTWQGPDEDPSSLAGYVTLGRGGAIVGAESLRDSFVIYSRSALSVLDYTGDALVWRRRTLSQNAGLIGRNALVEVKGKHYYISTEDIIVFDGNQAQSLLHNRLRKRFASTLNEDARSTAFATHHKTMQEIWFCVAEAGYDKPNMAYVYNYLDNTWSLRDLSTERVFAHALYGNQPTDVLSWEQWEGVWEGERTTWASANRQPFDGALIGASGNNVYNIDTQNPEEEGLTTFIERESMPIVGHEDTTTITRVYPQVEGNTAVTISLGSQQYAGGGSTWKKSVDFDPQTDRKIDIRTTGELHSYRMEGPANGNFNITGFDVEFQPAGGR